MSCVVVNVVFMLQVDIHHFYPGVISILKYSKIKSKILKVEGLVKKQIACIKHIKIHSHHMDVTFIPKHLILQGLKGVHILGLIMRFHTINVKYYSVMTDHVSISLIKKQKSGLKKLNIKGNINKLRNKTCSIMK